MSNFQDDVPSDVEIIPTEVRKPRRSLAIVIGVIAVVIVLAATAFIAGRLISPQASAQNGNGGPGSIVGGQAGQNHVNIHITRSKELPSTPPTVVGIVTDRQDQILSVGTGNVNINSIFNGPGQQPTVQASYNGPVVQVVITHDTKIYKDVTPVDPQTVEKNGGNLQQVLAPGSLDDIGKNIGIQVWGIQQGDRITADIIVYQEF